jgi:hypothetical protein
MTFQKRNGICGMKSNFKKLISLLIKIIIIIFNIIINIIVVENNNKKELFYNWIV